MVTQENYWNSPGHFSAHDPRQDGGGGGGRGRAKRGGRSVMSVPCEATSGSESQRRQRKRWIDEKQAVLHEEEEEELRIIWSDPPGNFTLRNSPTGFKECVLVCAVGVSTTRQSSVESLESGRRRISAVVRPAVTVVV